MTERMDLSSWWHRMRPRCHPAFPDASPIAPDALERRLRETFAPVVAPEPPARGVELPAFFVSYLERIGPSSWLGQRVRLDFELRSAAAILREVEYDLRTHDVDVVRASGSWLPFASAGKTTWFLCCDPRRPELGQVAEGEDAHPWDLGLESLGEPTAFAQWLDAVAAPSHRPDRRVLMALERAEAAELDRAIASGDPRELLVCVRDLECRLTPDHAWKHALGAPARVRLLVRELMREPAFCGREIYRDGETCASLLSFDALAAVDNLPAFAVAGWSAERRVHRIEGARDDLRAFARQTRPSCPVLLLSQDLTPVFDDDD